MKNLLRQYFFMGLIMMGLFVSGCGYTNFAQTPNDIKTIAVPMFKNQVVMSDTFTYTPGMEADITNDIIGRLNFDGNLKVVKPENADATIKGSITKYDQESIRYQDRGHVKEYRLFIVVDIELVDNRTGEVIFSEKGFTGRTEYFRDGTYAKSQRAAARSAREDLAKKVVDRIVEDW